MTIYSCVLFLHILGAFTLLIAIGIEWVGLARLRAAQTTALVREWMRVLGLLDTLVPIGVVLILGAGLYMTSSGWGWGNAWIDVSLAAFVAEVVVGATVLAPRLKLIRRVAEATTGGPVPAHLRQHILSTSLHTLVFGLGSSAMGIVCLMTVRPGWIGSLTVIAAFCFGGIGLSIRQRRDSIASMPRTTSPYSMAAEGNST